MTFGTRRYTIPIMSPSLALILSLLILIFALGLPTITRRLRSVRYARESARFLREPRVGDKAGYRIPSSLGPTTYLVGVVTLAGEGDEGVQMVELETDHTTALGTTRRHTWRAASTLRWFPPATPLGINTIDDPESGQ